MANLLAKKTLEMIQEESAEHGEHTLRRVLGPINLMTLGIGAIIGAGIFVLTGAAAAKYAGPAIVLSFVLAGSGLHLRRIVLCGVCLAHTHCRFGVHLRLCHLGRAFRLDYRLGPDPGVRFRRGHRRLRLERLRAQLLAGFWNSHSPANSPARTAKSW